MVIVEVQLVFWFGAGAVLVLRLLLESYVKVMAQFAPDELARSGIVMDVTRESGS